MRTLANAIERPGDPAPSDPALGRIRLAGLTLFEGLDETMLGAVEAQLEWFSLPGGWILFRRGEEADALYVVASGCLGVMVRGKDGLESLVARICEGETVGEMGLISGEPRSATVVSLHDTELLRLPKAAYERLIERHPQAMLRLTGLLARRLRSTTHGADRAPMAKNLALVPLNPALPDAVLVQGLVEALSDSGLRVRLLDSSAAEHTTEWFHAVGAAHDLVVYRAEPDPTAWTQLCLRQADRVLLLAAGASAPPVGLPIESCLGDAMRRSELVLLHDGAVIRPQGTARWLERLPVDTHYHVRLGAPRDLARLARFVTDRAVGLVLSGGGARGFAHVGVIRALREAGVPLDRLGGTSIGGIVAAGLGLEWDDGELADRLRRAFARSNPLSDYTLPLIALVRGRKVTRLLRDHFGDVRIEDLWLPYFCVSSNLTRGSMMAHRRGPLWRALRASVAIPGVLPPVVEAGQVLVDGGVIDNFPIDVMSAMRRGPVIGVDVATDRALTAPPADLEDGSPWRLLRRGRGAPVIVSLLLRAGTVSADARTRLFRSHADLLFEPPLETIDMLDWRAFDRAIEIGYRYAVEMLGHLDKPLFRTPARAVA